MRIYTSGRDFEITDDIQKRANKLARYIPNSVSLSVTMKHQKNLYKAIVNHTTQQREFYANATSHHSNTALNQAMEKLKSQIHRYKGRIKNQRQRFALSKVTTQLNVPIKTREDNRIIDANIAS